MDFNPVNFLTWVGLTAYLRKSLHYDLDEQIAFLSMSLLAIFSDPIADCSFQLTN